MTSPHTFMNKNLKILHSGVGWTEVAGKEGYTVEDGSAIDGRIAVAQLVRQRRHYTSIADMELNPPRV